MPLNKPISIIMTSSPVVGNVSSKFSQVLRLFTEFPVHHLPIVDDNNQLIGMVSTNDLPKVFLSLCSKENTVPMELDAVDGSVALKDFMSSNPVSIAASETIAKAVQIFSEKKFLALPVVSNGELVGIVSVKDIIGYLATHQV